MGKILKTFIKSFTLSGIGLCFLYMGRSYPFHKPIDEVLREDTDSVDTDQVEEYTLGQTAQVPREEKKNIRVLLKNTETDTYYHKTVIVSSPKGLEGDSGSISGPDESLDLAAVLKEGDRITLKSQGGDGEKIQIQSLVRDQGVPSYEGKIEVTKQKDGFILINEIDIETYLKYVVPSEMPPSYPEEALKAQAVCARTYGIRQMEENRLEEYHADVDDSVEFQVYNNLSRNPRSDQAVEATSHQVIMYRGKPVTAYFYSTSGGYSATESVWGRENSAPYLACEPLTDEENNAYEKEEPWFSWKVKIPVELLEERMHSVYGGLGKIKEINIIHKTEGGNVTAVDLISEDKEIRLNSEYDIREFFSPETLSITCQDGSIHENLKLLPSSCIEIERETQEDYSECYSITGRGYGHGVGLSQNGAKCMADQGMDMNEIIHTFFKDVDITRILN